MRGQTVPDHEVESEQNEGEIERAVALANQYPEIENIGGRYEAM